MKSPTFFVGFPPKIQPLRRWLARNAGPIASGTTWAMPGGGGFCWGLGFGGSNGKKTRGEWLISMEHFMGFDTRFHGGWDFSCWLRWKMGDTQARLVDFELNGI